MTTQLTATDTPISELATWISSVRYEAIPERVRNRAKVLLLDLLGVALAGGEADGSRAAERFASAALPGTAAVVWGKKHRASLLGAAYINATAANSLDLEDGNRAVVGHPGSLVIPAAFAAAQREAASGHELLEAIVVGYEVSIAVGGVRRPYPGDRWSHGWEVFGPAAAAARLFNLSAEGTAEALALAGFQGPNQPAGLATRAGSLVKSPCPGWAALSGVAGALMAEAGLTAPLSILDDDRHYSAAPPPLGTDWRLLDVYLKPHASCRWTHPAIDAVLSILKEDQVSPGDIRSVRVATFAEARLLDRQHPASAIQAQFSVPYTVAATLVDGEFGPRQQQAERLFDSEIASLADRVTIELAPVHDAAFPGETGATVTVATSHQVFERTVRNPLGDLAAPLNDGQVHEKFRRLTLPVLGGDGADALASAVMDIEGTTADALAALLTGNSRLEE